LISLDASLMSVRAPLADIVLHQALWLWCS
jgi:hypothetical protein